MSFSGDELDLFKTQEPRISGPRISDLVTLILWGGKMG